MKAELQNKLIQKYPKLFQDVLDGKGPTETLMCFGCECGDGWYDLLDSTLAAIYNHCENEERRREERFKEKHTFRYWRRAWFDLKWTLRQWWYNWFPAEGDDYEFFRLSQVKEKYGGLEVYTWSCDDFVDGAVSVAENMSLKLCEKCGDPGQPNYLDENGEHIPDFGGWIRTRCKNDEEDR